MKPILECRNLTKKYGNFSALSSLDLTLEKGQISGLTPGPESKELVSYLPDRTYLNRHMRVRKIVDFYMDFYKDFSMERAFSMLDSLDIDPRARLSSLSRGTREKVQLVLVMSRQAGLYVLDEPLGGVDPAARDYILHTILTNYSEDASILISTHLIADIENILDRVLFLQKGHLALNASVDEIRGEYGKSVDTLFREVFKCWEN